MTEYTSPSGKYNLIVEQIETKPGCWNYTRGTVSTIDEVLIKVERNYSSFPFLFIEDHPDGYDYLVCGSDYQGQTVINLNTLETRTHIPEEAKQGHGFCWAEYTYNRELNILIVDGCYWACPYEYKFYDFSEPMAGWPEITSPGIYAEGIPPTIKGGRITCYDARICNGDDLEDPEDKFEAVAFKTYVIENKMLCLVAQWVDEAEKIRREASRIAYDQYQFALLKYKAEDPIYLLVQETVKSGSFPKARAEIVGFGQCYNGWHPTETYDDARVCIDLIRQHGVLTIELNWGRTIAPIKLMVTRAGQTTTTWYEHSIEGMQQALELAKKEYNNG